MGCRVKLLALSILAATISKPSDGKVSIKKLESKYSVINEQKDQSSEFLLHDSNFWFDNRNSGCNFTMSGKFISYNLCYGEVILTSTLGIHSVKCSDLAYLVLFGTIHLSSGNCSEILMTNPICEGYPIDGNPMLIPCRTSTRSDTKILLTLAILMSISEIIIFRLIWITKSHKCKNGTAIHRIYSKRIMTFKLESGQSKVKYLKSKEGPPVTGDTVLKQDLVYKYEHFNWKSILLLFLFIHRPTSVDGYNQTAETATFLLSKSGSITLDDFHLTLHDVTYKYILTKEYVTGNWWGNWTTNTDCLYARCNPYGNCPNGGIHGILGEKSSWTKSQNGIVSRYFLRNCRWGNSGCYLTSGCDNVVFNFFWNKNLLSTVYRIGEGTATPDITVSLSKSCSIIGIAPEGSLILPEMSVLNHYDGTWSIGPKASVRSKPVAGMIGDFQLDNNGKMTYDLQSVTFTHGAGSGWGVNTRHGSFSKWIKEYTLLPGQYQSDLYQVKSGFLERIIDVPLEVTISCKPGILKNFHSQSCGGLSFRVTGMIGSKTAVILHISPRIKIPNSFWSGKLPCIEKNVQVDCVSDGVMIKIPWPNECVGNLNLSVVNVAEENGFVDLSESHSAFSNIVSNEKGFFGNLQQLITSAWSSAALLSPPVLLLIGFLIVRG